eukprot:TRINITY_DN2186_c0_g1_i6.p1 TRINITY_DN2186_c0_g1~~TRINITY_DN2186_c0_g1_i6.p1  ORF type:complete len:903 (+),score=295.28 TRINITY_DN2186_c0_g1_i6:2328-5036(+)
MEIKAGDKPNERLRLPRTVVPVHYHVALTPNPAVFNTPPPIPKENRTFAGVTSVILELKTKDPVHEIIFHSLDLEFKAGDVTLHAIDAKLAGQLGDWPEPPQGSIVVPIASAQFEEEWETCTLKTNADLASFNTNVFLLRIAYQSKFNDMLKGFYLSFWKNQTIATTQFEPTDARRSFPCWDEPSFKATFSVDITVPNRGLQVISNMPIKELKSTPQEDFVFYRFDKSPIMSTYLVAYVIGKFDYLSSKSKKGVEVRVYVMPGKLEQARFAIKTATAALDFFVDFFGIDYPLPKVDLLGIPDFAAGAMENWGCITYRETKLLIDPVASSLDTMQRSARTISHELAHMWFGNLVTMEWWTHLWLNEGFARFMEFLAVDHIFPHWSIWDNFVFEVLDAAQSLDSLKTSHPIEVEVKNSKDVDSIFDTISYAKGASVIRMLSNYIGGDNFQIAVRNYLKKFSYQNALTADLWEAFENQVHMNIVDLMFSWTKVVGYPVISVNFDPANKSLTLTQSRFLRDGSEDPAGSVWEVPVRITFFGPDGHVSANDQVLLTTTTETFQLKDSTAVFVLNPGRVGFYRVAYPVESYQATFSSNFLAKLQPLDLLTLQDDAFALANAGKISISSYLNLVSQFPVELPVPVYYSLVDNLRALVSLHSDLPYSPALKELVHKLLKFNFDKYLSPANQKTVFCAKSVEEKQSLFETKTLAAAASVLQDSSFFQNVIDTVRGDSSAIRADLKGTLYALTVREGCVEDYDHLMDIYKKSEFPEERNKALVALGASKSEDLLVKTLKWALQSDEVRGQDAYYVFAAAGGSAVGRRVAWAVIQSDFAKICEKLPPNLASALVSGSLSGFGDESIIPEISAFFGKQKLPFAYSEIEKVLERIKIRNLCILWQAEASICLLRN